ncbi:hypothetical protein [Streptomyces prunicolor]|uniref:hypothetical protein n=1 Tax=Streptomyces prunicolor TaxID=67348 RepID=UPI0009977785|nr:hypothetical protein [Streptomyces prunicolor]
MRPRDGHQHDERHQEYGRAREPQLAVPRRQSGQPGRGDEGGYGGSRLDGTAREAWLLGGGAEAFGEDVAGGEDRQVGEPGGAVGGRPEGEDVPEGEEKGQQAVRQAESAAAGRGVAGAFEVQGGQFTVRCRAGPGAHLALLTGHQQAVGAVRHGDGAAGAGQGRLDDPFQGLGSDRVRYAWGEVGSLLRGRREESQQGGGFGWLGR